ncbi:MAG: polymer-forming cytoskeletal protein [Proteobacteria bacterium]|nr:polymer-forming cytoskeletal protein [Cystobacterineae bacterium]MCL2258947.1 polymer-forming cytoskeletal protein [Cystobacterineae bacterium]MCL2314110.1 polymer-forming cytoskeletal protein [Pseudomonadota bacterium]
MSGEAHTLLGRGSEFEGKLSFEGQVQIDGKFKGSIVAQGTLVIGETAEVYGDIMTSNLVVHGRVEGTLKASESIELHEPSKVQGTLETPVLSIAKGVHFDGECHMTKAGASAASKSSSNKSTSYTSSASYLEASSLLDE